MAQWSLFEMGRLEKQMYLEKLFQVGHTFQWDKTALKAITDFLKKI